MLVVPDVYRKYSILAIDPGLSKCGIARLNFVEGQVVSIDATTIINTRISFESEYQPEYHAERQIALNRLGLAFRSVLDETGPILVVSEGPFYNPLMPMAFGSLVETIAVLRMITSGYNPTVPFVTFQPQVVKQTFKRSGVKGKIVMREALSENEELCAKLTTPLELLDEHAVDAVAVGETAVIHLFQY